jgi:hypothetical protein
VYLLERVRVIAEAEREAAGELGGALGVVVLLQAVLHRGREAHELVEHSLLPLCFGEHLHRLHVGLEHPAARLVIVEEEAGEILNEADRICVFRLGEAQILQLAVFAVDWEPRWGPCLLSPCGLRTAQHPPRHA